MPARLEAHMAAETFRAALQGGKVEELRSSRETAQASMGASGFVGLFSGFAALGASDMGSATAALGAKGGFAVAALMLGGGAVRFFRRDSQLCDAQAEEAEAAAALRHEFERGTLEEKVAYGRMAQRCVAGGDTSSLLAEIAKEAESLPAEAMAQAEHLGAVLETRFASLKEGPAHLSAFKDFTRAFKALESEEQQALRPVLTQRLFGGAAGSLPALTVQGLRELGIQPAFDRFDGEA